MVKNPWDGLKIALATAGARQREPFSIDQLNTLLAAPLYTGCVNDGQGFSKPGPAYPRRARFWVALIGLYSGLRLNEIGQLDLADVAPVDGVECFHVRRRSHLGPDKRVKSPSSQRLVPVHPMLIKLGFDLYLAERRASGEAGKLFPELRPCVVSFTNPRLKFRLRRRFRFAVFDQSQHPMRLEWVVRPSLGSRSQRREESSRSRLLLRSSNRDLRPSIHEAKPARSGRHSSRTLRPNVNVVSSLGAGDRTLLLTIAAASPMYTEGPTGGSGARNGGIDGLEGSIMNAWSNPPKRDR